MTRRQSNNQWRGGMAAHPDPPQKNSECKNPLENFSPWFYGIKTAFSSSIIIQRANLSTRSITRFCWCNWRTFWRKTPREDHQSGLVLARKCPSSPGTCNPEETGPLSFQYHDHPPYSPDLPLSHYHRFPGLKKQLIGRHFSSDAEVIVAAETWLDGRGEFGCLLWETCGIQQQAVWTKCWDSFVTAVFLSCCINCTSICYRNFNGQYNCPTLLCRRSIFNLDCATAGT